jgi:hypothetical protein
MHSHKNKPIGEKKRSREKKKYGCLHITAIANAKRRYQYMNARIGIMRRLIHNFSGANEME